MSGYREEPSIRLSYVLEFDDFGRQWAPLLRAQVHRSRLVLALTAVLSGIVFLATLPYGVSHGALLATVLVLGAIGRNIPMTTPEQAFGDTWEDRRHVNLEVDSTELVLEDRLSRIRLDWELVLRFEENEGAFLIYTGPDAFHVIPKRVLHNAAQETLLRQLLEDGVVPHEISVSKTVERLSWIPSAMYVVGLGLFLTTVIEAVARELGERLSG